MAIWLMDRTGSPMAPGLYLAATAAISLLCVLGVRDMAGQPLPTDAKHPFPRLYNGSVRER
jgi:hypothetical protein